VASVRRFRSWLLAVSLCAPLAACTVGTDVSGTVVRSVNEPLPALSGEGVEEASVSAQSFVGKVLVVNAWATWCQPCRREQPDLVQLAGRFAKQGVAFMGINHQDDKAKAADWIRSYGVPYASIYDPAGKMAQALSFVGLPDTWVVDRTGTIRYIVNGPTNAAQLGGLIDDVLALSRSQASASTATATNSAPK
jgi:DsbE subfamily thiol:disulfide oxidoreductase